MSPDEIEILEYDPFDYAEALIFSVNTYKLRSMGTTDSTNSKPSGNSEKIIFDQPADYDHDPLYVSYVGNKK